MILGDREISEKTVQSSPKRSSLTSLEAFSRSSRRFLSIILLLSTAALSSALIVQPISALWTLCCRTSGSAVHELTEKTVQQPPGRCEVSQPRRSGGRGEGEKKRRWHRRLDCPSVEQTRTEVSHSPLTFLLPGGKNIRCVLMQNVQLVCTLKTRQRPNAKK